MENNFEAKYIVFTIDSDNYYLKPCGTTTFEDIMENLEGLRTVAQAVVQSVDDLEDGETVTIPDFFTAFCDTVAENITNAAGEPFTLCVEGIGFDFMKIVFDDEEE